ncbi:phage tail sheath family protein [Methylovorus menthalis]|nr:phage tail sheath family protein [Methylovorus menthalis]
MPKEYSTPGVYVEETATTPPAIEAMASGVPVFIGYTEIAGTSQEPLTLIPRRISHQWEFIQLFGSAYPESGFAVTIHADGTAAAVVQSSSPHVLHDSLELFFANGGQDCWVISTGRFKSPGEPLQLAELQAGLDVAATMQGIDLIIIPEMQALSLADYRNLADATLSHAATCHDRFAILDMVIKPATGNTPSLAQHFHEGVEIFREQAIGQQHLAWGSVYAPHLMVSLPRRLDETNICVTLADGTVASLANLFAHQRALYTAVIAAIHAQPRALPPSGAIAGCYAAQDRNRGIWKAPANMTLALVNAPAVELPVADYETMNVDVTRGKSINPIRLFTHKGTLVWGARTLAGNDNEWRYVPTRRLCTWIETCVRRSVGWLTFEENTAATWQKLQSSVEIFLMMLWRNSVFLGDKPEQAFFVRVGQGITMTLQDVVDGRVRLEIGLATQRPSEFVHMQLSFMLRPPA